MSIFKKRYLFLDIDGVLHDFSNSESRHHLKTIKGHGYSPSNVTVDLEVIEKLKNLIKEFSLNPEWLTVWQDDAPIVFSQVDLGKNWKVNKPDDVENLNSYFREIYGKEPFWWKSLIVEKLLKKSNTEFVVWIDDEISKFRNDGLIPDFVIDSDKLIRLSPNSESKLTLENIENLSEELKKFLEEIRKA